MPTDVPAPGVPELLGLDQLHPEQRAAATHGEGPLLIVAGAGTGKTQVVTQRIAWLISTKRARPEQILALTFTDKAAAEMESRVDQLVPYGLVGATISTFNAFCDRLVRAHAVELGLTSRLRVETEAEILVFLRERLFDLGLQRYLPLGRPDAHLRAFLSLFDRARNEDVSPERYAEFAERLDAEAGDDPARRDRAESELEKARVFANYEALLHTAGRVDFGSQIALALRLLRERPHVLRSVRDQYRWILVDEFQDTNHVQFEFVRLLAGERRNLTVVGDDDQSIYRFRGARIENLLGFLEAYPDARQVLLVRNHRSGQTILDRAHRLVRVNDPHRLEARRGWDKRLLAQRTAEDGSTLAGVVEHHTFQTGRDEAEWVAATIAEGLAAGRRPRDFAVLGRAHGHLDPFALALQGRGI
ncbi:MAG: ATP-dependent helicase, partial [bacterium]